MNPPKKFVKYSVFRSFRYAFNGLIHALKREPNLIIQLVVGLLSAAVAIFLGWYTLALITLVMMSAVASFEMINTALEALCDIVEPKKNVKIKYIKDFSAGAVLIVSLVWFCVLLYESVLIAVEIFA